MTQKQKPLRYVEPIPIKEKFALGPACVKEHEGCVFITIYVDHMQPPELGGGMARRINGRLIMPRSGAERLRDALGQALAGEAYNLEDCCAPD